MRVNHVTYHLSPKGLADIHTLMTAIGCLEITPDDAFEHGYDVRWFILYPGQPLIHFVATPEEPDAHDYLSLGHFCVEVSLERFKRLMKHPLVSRNSGSGRFWMELDALRVEVRCLVH